MCIDPNYHVSLAQLMNNNIWIKTVRANEILKQPMGKFNSYKPYINSCFNYFFFKVWSSYTSWEFEFALSLKLGFEMYENFSPVDEAYVNNK